MFKSWNCLVRKTHYEETNKPKHHCVSVGQHLEWLAGLGFEDADCLWKWRELALVAGVRT